MTHLLTSLPPLSPYLPALQALGYTTYEQFVSASQAAGPELADYLGLASLNSLFLQISVSATPFTEEVRERLDALPCALGVSIERVPRLINAPALPLLVAAEPKKSLISELPPIRNQGLRGTCVAHAALSAYEHYLHINGSYQDLSEQFLYWNCKRNDAIPGISGTFLGVCFPLLERDGCCLETSWPYVSQSVAGNEAQDPLPAGTQLEALSFRLGTFRQLAPTSVSDIKAEILNRRCVAVSIPVFNSWYLSREIRRTGEITNPVPNEVQHGGHAICLVGYLDMPQSPEIDGGRFLVRNSWGIDWAMDSPHGPGYGTIPYSYIAKFGVEAYTIV